MTPVRDLGFVDGVKRVTKGVAHLLAFVGVAVDPRNKSANSHAVREGCSSQSLLFFQRSSLPVGSAIPTVTDTGWESISPRGGVA